MSSLPTYQSIHIIGKSGIYRDWHFIEECKVTSLFLMFLVFSVRRSSCSSSLRLARSDEDDALRTAPEGRALEWSGEKTFNKLDFQNRPDASPMRNEDKMIEISLSWSPSLVTKLLNPLGILRQRIWILWQGQWMTSSGWQTGEQENIFTLIRSHGSPTRESQKEKKGDEGRQRRHVTSWTASGQLKH